MNETQQTNVTDHKQAPFGARLKSAREALGLERKDAATQLRLNEKVIMMMEKDRYPSDLPATFIRGYIRAYGKLLQIPEYEIKKAVEPIKPKPSAADIKPVASLEPPPGASYFMQIVTYLIFFTVIGLVGIWWYTRANNVPAPAAIENTSPTAPEIASPPVTEQLPAMPKAPAPSVNAQVPPAADNPQTGNGENKALTENPVSAGDELPVKKAETPRTAHKDAAANLQEEDEDFDEAENAEHNTETNSENAD